MFVYILICTLFPAFISVMILSNRENDNKKLFLSYFLYNILINISCVFTILLYKKDSSLMIDSNFCYFQFCARYLLIGLVFAVIIPYIVEFISKNIKVSIDIKKGRK